MAEIDLSAAKWLNEPPDWSLDGGVLSLTTGEKTDFWQGTLYNFHRDNGHALLSPVEGDFTAVLTFEGDYQTLYDQAGMMLRVDAANWIKLGIEYTDGATNFSIVVTRGQSDWSVVQMPTISGPQQVRLTRVGDAVAAHFHTGEEWRLLRVADFMATAAARIGPMACSPQREGFQARFLSMTVKPPIDDPVHATTL